MPFVSEILEARTSQSRSSSKRNRKNRSSSKNNNSTKNRNKECHEDKIVHEKVTLIGFDFHSSFDFLCTQRTCYS